MPKYNYPKIVVTGLGPITAIGNNKDEFWQAMLDIHSKEIINIKHKT